MRLFYWQHLALVLLNAVLLDIIRYGTALPYDVKEEPVTESKHISTTLAWFPSSTLENKSGLRKDETFLTTTSRGTFFTDETKDRVTSNFKIETKNTPLISSNNTVNQSVFTKKFQKGVPSPTEKNSKIIFSGGDVREKFNEFKEITETPDEGNSTSLNGYFEPKINDKIKSILTFQSKSEKRLNQTEKGLDENISRYVADYAKNTVPSWKHGAYTISSLKSDKPNDFEDENKDSIDKDKKYESQTSSIIKPSTSFKSKIPSFRARTHSRSEIYSNFYRQNTNDKSIVDASQIRQTTEPSQPPHMPIPRTAVAWALTTLKAPITTSTRFSSPTIGPVKSFVPWSIRLLKNSTSKPDILFQDSSSKELHNNETTEINKEVSPETLEGTVSEESSTEFQAENNKSSTLEYLDSLEEIASTGFDSFLETSESSDLLEENLKDKHSKNVPHEIGEVNKFVPSYHSNSSSSTENTFQTPELSDPTNSPTLSDILKKEIVSSDELEEPVTEYHNLTKSDFKSTTYKQENDSLVYNSQKISTNYDQSRNVVLEGISSLNSSNRNEVISPFNNTISKNSKENVPIVEEFSDTYTKQRNVTLPYEEIENTINSSGKIKPNSSYSLETKEFKNHETTESDLGISHSVNAEKTNQSQNLTKPKIESISVELGGETHKKREPLQNDSYVVSRRNSSTSNFNTPQISFNTSGPNVTYTLNSDYSTLPTVLNPTSYINQTELDSKIDNNVYEEETQQKVPKNEIQTEIYIENSSEKFDLNKSVKNVTKIEIGIKKNITETFPVSSNNYIAITTNPELGKFDLILENKEMTTLPTLPKNPSIKKAFNKTVSDESLSITDFDFNGGNKTTLTNYFNSMKNSNQSNNSNIIDISNKMNHSSTTVMPMSISVPHQSSTITPESISNVLFNNNSSMNKEHSSKHQHENNNSFVTPNDKNIKVEFLGPNFIENSSNISQKYIPLPDVPSPTTELVNISSYIQETTEINKNKETSDIYQDQKPNINIDMRVTTEEAVTAPSLNSSVSSIHTNKSGKNISIDGKPNHQELTPVVFKDDDTDAYEDRVLNSTDTHFKDLNLDSNEADENFDDKIIDKPFDIYERNISKKLLDSSQKGNNSISSTTRATTAISTIEEKVNSSEQTTPEFEDPVYGTEVTTFIKLSIEAPKKDICLSKRKLKDAISLMFTSREARRISQKQIVILNFGDKECRHFLPMKSEKVSLKLYLTNNQGQYDDGLTNSLFNLYKEKKSFNFPFPVISLEKISMDQENGDGESPGSGTMIAAIVISSVAGLCLLSLTILLVVMRKRQRGFNYGQRCTPVSLEDYSLDNISVYNSVRRKAVRASKRSYGNLAFDDSGAISNPMSFASLANFCNDRAKMDDEFSQIPTVTVKPDELPPGVEHKNRYANVIPLPETRVQIRLKQGVGAIDQYINANYVKGAKGTDKGYIACQAPLQDTIKDFWLMVWEQQSRIIIMLTDLHENGVEKCADYLPSSEVVDCHRVFGDLQVTLKKREVREKYIISSLQLKNLESNLWREVTHMWYIAWPHQGVPKEPSAIIAFLIEARSYIKSKEVSSPAVVHCSPGTGRTGTVIAIDICIREFEMNRTVDVPRALYSIRRDRAGFVQTKDQYAYIYQVLHLYATKLTGGGLDSI